MTSLLIRALSRRPAAVLARPASVAALAIALAYTSGLWTVLLHHVEGGTETGEPPLLVHWLRDSTLGLPAIFAAVWLAVVLARGVIERQGAQMSDAMATLVLGALTAIAAAAATALGNPLHATLFGAHHGGKDLPLVVHMARDGLVVLVVNLPVAFAACALLRRRAPWRAPRVASWGVPASMTGRVALRGALGLIVVAPVAVFAQTGAQLAAAGAGPGTPCPADAPLKTFDVQAINVKIPLNRFGDNDPQGRMLVLSDQIGAVRAQEASQKVSIGLKDDPIQPLAIRANEGDCVQIRLDNNLTTDGDIGLHIDGLSYDVASSGDAVGNNESSAISASDPPRTYRYFIPREPEFEGAHYMHPGPGNRQAVAHGLFGSLVVEPPGSTYLNPSTGQPQPSGWEATIVPGSGKSFRENVKALHEIGDESFDIGGPNGTKLPRVDPHTTSYRPGSRGINYRSEPFMNRLARNGDWKSLAYNSFTFGDPATPMPRGYLGDPTKFRIIHPGTEMFHVYHLHGGGIRGAMTRSPITASTTATRAWTSTRRSARRTPRAWTRSPRAPASRSTWRSRAAPAACSSRRATSSSTATSPSTTSRACGASGAPTTRCSPTSSRCPTAPRCRRPSRRIS